jgi:FkbM family methyltransferase
MKKAIVFGLGQHYDSIKGWIYANYDVVALTDNDSLRRQERQSEGLVIRSEQIPEFDCIVMAVHRPLWADTVRCQCEEMGIAPEKLVFPLRLLTPFSLNDIYEHNGIRIKMRSYSDMLVFDDVLVWGAYPQPPINDDYILIDIGMNVGVTSLFYANFPNIKRVYGYELFESTYRLALDNFALNPQISEKITAHPFGLGRENKALTLKRPAFLGGASMFDQIAAANPTDTKKDSIDCEIKNASQALHNIITEHSGESRLMMKIDCEGAEWEIFDDLAQSGLLPRFEVIVGEWHLYNFPSQRDRGTVFDKFISNIKGAGLKFTQLKGNPFSDVLGTFTLMKGW